jgi:hypothetical protein
LHTNYITNIIPQILLAPKADERAPLRKTI